MYCECGRYKDKNSEANLICDTCKKPLPFLTPLEDVMKVEVDISSSRDLTVNMPRHPLTKREYFAAMMFQGILAGKYITPEYASAAVIMADNLIKELNKEVK